MKDERMTPLQRVLTTLGQKEPDRVPLFLFPTLHGARELGLSIRDYFSVPEHVAEGQLKLYKKYRNDCLSAFYYGPIETEAWGGEVIFVEDGPPNSGRPFIRSFDEIPQLRPPVVEETPCLSNVLKTIQILKSEIGDNAPINGVAISPFSLPIMQMGFDRYIELLYKRQDLFNSLMKVNEEFCVNWANAQIAAGATAICYFDPVSSPTIIPRNLFLQTGFKIAARTISRIKGPTAIHLASGRCLPIIEDLVKTGTQIVGTSALEDLKDVKSACRGRLTVLGNLNGIEMRHWTPDEAEKNVKTAIAKAGPGGGFILSDNHGEIPWQVPDDILKAISDAVHTWGNYPLDWIGQDE